VLVDLKTGKSIRTLKSQDRGATALLFSRDGKKLFKRTFGAAVGEWEVATGKMLRQLGMKAAAPADDRVELPDAPLALSPDGLALAACGVDNRIHLFDLATGKEKSLGGHGEAVDRLQFAPDGYGLWTAAGCLQ
jgi:WD40 repeat protein